MTRWLPLALFVAGGCAPLYRPAPPQVLLLEQQGDLNISAHASTGGYDASGGYALSDHLVMRAGGQLAGPASDGEYERLSAGFGVFTKTGPMRYAALLDAGGGYTSGVSSITISGTTSTTVYQGSFGLLSLHLEFGGESNNVAYAIVLRPSVQSTWHNAGSSRLGRTTQVIGEALTALRFGAKDLKLELDAGVAWPLASQDDIGVPFPLVLGVGLVFDRRLTPPTQQ